MVNTGEFVFLKLDVKDRKKKEDGTGAGQYLIVDFVDSAKNPCKFFVFNETLMAKLLSLDLAYMQILNVKYDVDYHNNIWQVKLVDVNG